METQPFLISPRVMQIISVPWQYNTKEFTTESVSNAHIRIRSSFVIKLLIYASLALPI